MVVVKVRETYDLATVRNKMTVIAVHTPEPDIIKRNYPGLLMQCKAYRPVSCDVKIACASVLPLDPLGVGTREGDVAPEDMFNPILYKAMTNVGMSQLEARICALSAGSVDEVDVSGDIAEVDVDSNTTYADEFPMYYGLLADAHGWKHASPQQGLVMTNLRPKVFEILHNVADQAGPTQESFSYPSEDGTTKTKYVQSIRGNAKPLPFINCTSYSYRKVPETQANDGIARAGFLQPEVYNAEVDVPYINCCVAGIIIPPSKLHQLFYRMVCEWDIEFSMIRPLSEIMDWSGLRAHGNATHFQNYNYTNTKMALTGSEDTILDSDTCMVSANVDVKKVM